MIIGLDVDGVLINWVDSFIAKAKQMGFTETFPKSWKETYQWQFSPDFGKVWKEIEQDENWWLNLSRHDDAKVTFPVDFYLTARPCPSEITRECLVREGFPDAPVHTVHPKADKVPVLKELGTDLFVEDKLEAFLDINGAGINCLLLNRPWNDSYCSFKRIYSLNDVPLFIDHLVFKETCAGDVCSEEFR
jgi:hypothetical protein